MSNIQIMLKDADQANFRNWIFSIYKPKEEAESPDFSICVDKQQKDYYLKFNSEEDNVEELKPFIEDLKKSKDIELVVGQYTYSKNEEGIKWIKSLLKFFSMRDSNLPNQEIGIVVI